MKIRGSGVFQTISSDRIVCIMVGRDRNLGPIILDRMGQLQSPRLQFQDYTINSMA